MHSQEVAACVSAHSCTVLKNTMMLRPGEVQATVLLMHQANSQGNYSNVDSLKHTVDKSYGTRFTVLYCLHMQLFLFSSGEYHRFLHVVMIRLYRIVFSHLRAFYCELQLGTELDNGTVDREGNSSYRATHFISNQLQLLSFFLCQFLLCRPKL